MVTTPIAYITKVPPDDFDVYGGYGPYALPIKMKIAGWAFNPTGTGFYTSNISISINNADGLYATDQKFVNREDNNTNTQYALFSMGPGHQLYGSGWFTIPGEGDTGAINGHFPQPFRYWYDPTNGTVSAGYVVRLSGGVSSP